jgi:hypothetical protein
MEMKMSVEESKQARHAVRTFSAKFVYAHVYGKIPGAAGNKNLPGVL